MRRAGVAVARILYRDDRTKAIVLVVVQSEALERRRPSGGCPHGRRQGSGRRPPSSRGCRRARRLLGALNARGAAAGLAVRTLEVPALRPEAIARVIYSDGALAGTAADIAKDANLWLEQNDPGRPALAASLHPKVVARTILIGLPDRGSATAPSATAPLPDVHGIDLADARRKLFAAGVTAFDYKWSADPSRKPMEVVEQSEIPSRPGGRRVVLTSVAKGTLLVYHLGDDAPLVDRLAADMMAKMTGLGVLVRPVRQSVLKRDFVGKIVGPDGLAKEGTMMAEFSSSWLTKELGRTVRIRASTDRMGPRELMFWFPSLR
jgi:hypothetical protein